MNSPKQSVSLIRKLLIGGAFLALSCGIGVAAGEMLTAPRNIEVVATMSTAADTVEVVRSGQRLEVIAKEGSWLQVRTPSGKTGYVLASRIQRRGGGLDIGAVTGGPSASAVSSATAGRGLSPEAAGYAQSRGYPTDAPDRLVAFRLNAKPDLKAFKDEGNVGSK